MVKNRTKCRIPFNKSPILLSGLWRELGERQRLRLERLGFTPESWDSNVREGVAYKDGDLHVTSDRTPVHYDLMIGDRAMTPLSPTSELFERR